MCIRYGKFITVYKWLKFNDNPIERSKGFKLNLKQKIFLNFLLIEPEDMYWYENVLPVSSRLANVFAQNSESTFSSKYFICSTFEFLKIIQNIPPIQEYFYQLCPVHLLMKNDEYLNTIMKAKGRANNAIIVPF